MLYIVNIHIFLYRGSIIWKCIWPGFKAEEGYLSEDISFLLWCTIFWVPVSYQLGTTISSRQETSTIDFLDNRLDTESQEEFKWVIWHFIQENEMICFPFLFWDSCNFQRACLQSNTNSSCLSFNLCFLWEFQKFVIPPLSCSRLVLIFKYLFVPKSSFSSSSFSTLLANSFFHSSNYSGP